MFLRIRLFGIIEAQKGTSPVLPTGPVASFPVERGRDQLDADFLTRFMRGCNPLFVPRTQGNKIA